MRPIKILILILFISSLSASAQKNCVPTFGVANAAVMMSVVFNTVYEPSPIWSDSGYTLDTSLKTKLILGKPFDLSFSFSNPGQCAVWIDYDNDSKFSSSECVFIDRASEKEIYGTITVPLNSSYLGLRRLRILYTIDGAILGPCSQYSYGQCRDYIVDIVSDSSPKSQDYCIPAQDHSANFPIDNFILHQLINERSGSDTSGYTFYPDTLFTTNLRIGQSYLVEASCGQSAGVNGGFSVWIDLNNDGLFALQERLFHKADVYSASGLIFIPADSSCMGIRRLRVMSQMWNEPILPCISDRSIGETEDYLVRIIPNCNVTLKPGEILGDNGICNGSTQVYSIEPVEGAIRYQWLLPEGWAGHSKDTFITVITNGIGGVISVAASDSCDYGPWQTMPVTPVIDTTISFDPGNSTMTSNTSDASYQWIKCEYIPKLIAGATEKSYKVQKEGYYAVIITKDLCTDTSDCYWMMPFTGQNELMGGTQLSISPNPIINGKISITCSAEMNEIIIYNCIGEKIYTLHDLSDNKVDIDLSAFPSGIYFLNALSGDAIITKKIVKAPK